MNRKLYQVLASKIDAMNRCIKENNTEWKDKHEDSILELVKAHMPSGSGIDCGTKIDLERSTGEKLVFSTEYHHMNDCGMYDGWTSHVITVKPSLAFGMVLSISGRDRNQIKEYLYDVFHNALTVEIDG